MKDFDSMKECEKCSGSNYYSDGDFFGKRVYFPESWKDGDKVPEHLLNTCHHCGYTFKEKCKGNK